MPSDEDPDSGGIYQGLYASVSEGDQFGRNKPYDKLQVARPT